MKNKKSEQGFTYIDVMIGIVILLVGILALLSAITGAVFQSKGQELQMDAKQIATSTMESIMAIKEATAKSDDTLQLGWSKVGNIDTNPNENGVPQGIFVKGLQPVYATPGVDQIFGTPDDGSDSPGSKPIPGFQRQILITDQCDLQRPSANCPTPGTYSVRVRTVVITVTYFVGTIQRQEQLATTLTDYSVSANQ